MTEYYSLVAKAVDALGPHTEQARRRVYDRARAALLSEVQKLVPTLDQSKVMTEQFYLDLAIGEVEQREQSARSTVGTPPTVFPGSIKVAAPSPQANQNDNEVCKAAPARPEQPADEDDCERLRDTWLTDLLARASRGANNDQTDFTPKRALRRAARGTSN
jgi:hypothetical protein